MISLHRIELECGQMQTTLLSQSTNNLCTLGTQVNRQPVMVSTTRIHYTSIKWAYNHVYTKTIECSSHTFSVTILCSIYAVLITFTMEHILQALRPLISLGIESRDISN